MTTWRNGSTAGARERVMVVGDGDAARAIALTVAAHHEVHVERDPAQARSTLAHVDMAAVVVAFDEVASAEAGCEMLFADVAARGGRRPCALLAVPAGAADAALRMCEGGLFDDYVVPDAGDPHRPALVLRHALERRRLQDTIVARLDQLASIRRDIGESGWRIGRRLVIDGADLGTAGQLAVDVAGAFARADLALGGCAQALSTALQPFAPRPADALARG